MRILLAAFGTRGDVQPMVALGTRLRADGHEVVVGASAGFADWVRGHGLEFRAVGLDIEAWIRDHGGMIDNSARFLSSSVRYLREDAELAFDQTLAAARGADLIVSGVHAAAPSVAEVLGLPYRTLLFCPQLIPSRFHPPPGAPWFSLPHACNRLLWRAARCGFEFTLKDTINRRRSGWGLPGIRDLSGYLVHDCAIVASDGALAGLPPDAPSAIVQTGSLALDADGTLDPGLERFLGDGEPPVYVGFGSMPNGDPRRTTRRIVEALESCHRRGVIVSGWGGLGGEDLPSTVFVARSTSHARLLPRVALAVHHGGAGTTAAAARAGVPQIVVPHLADQFYWGHQIHARGLGGRPISRSSLTAPKLARAIQFVLSRPHFAETARSIQASLERTDGVSTLAHLLYRVASNRSERSVAA